jgi:hypothetical protein
VDKIKERSSMHGGMRTSHKILVGKTKWNKLLCVVGVNGRIILRRYLKETGCEYGDYSQLD